MRLGTGAGVLLAVLAYSGITHAQERVNGYSQEYESRVSSAQKIGQLNDALFGEHINESSGETIFTSTDLEIPGNNSLRVAIDRKFNFSAERKYRSRSQGKGAFANWELDIPYLEGVFSSQTGWQAGNVAGVRCNAASAQNAAPPTVNSFESFKYWSGNSLVLPNIGSNELLFVDGNTINKPTDGMSYKWVTKNNWFFSCLQSTSNGVVGDSFLAVSPEGTKYWFNHID